MMIPHKTSATMDGAGQDSLGGIFLVFLRLGLTSFGGPIAHIGYFRDEFVQRRHWLSERSYSDLVALCQFLPGPASSQVGMALGLLRHGYGGALAAWAGFTLPSAIALMLFALGMSNHALALPVGAVQGLKVLAVAVVVQAVWGMAKHLCADTPRVTLMAMAAGIASLFPSAIGQVLIIVGAAFVGIFFFDPGRAQDHQPLPFNISQRAGLLGLTLLFSLLFGLPLAVRLLPYQSLAEISVFFRSGALVFGGGHVVLPLLQAAVVPAGWVSKDVFLAGYAAAQAIPGPLFSFAAFLGAAMNTAPSGWLGGLLCLLAIFAPSFLLLIAALPFWQGLRRNAGAQAALMGVNAAVVGLLLAALYHPLWTSAIHQARDFSLLVAAVVALMFWRLPVWLVVLGCATAGALMH